MMLQSLSMLATASVELISSVGYSPPIEEVVKIDPDTWPEQTQLAAAGDWDGLDQLQDSLKGGRRV